MSPDRVRLFVAGATGYTGQAVVRRARTRGLEVIAHVRPDSPSLAEWRVRFETLGATVDMTPWDEDAMQDTLEHHRPTHVFALLGTTRARARRSDDAGERADPYEAVDYGLTALLLRAAQASAVEPTLVYLSALGADARSGNSYIAVRGRLERELRNSGLRYLVVRPSFITGGDRPEPRRLERIAARATDLAVRALGAVGLGRFGARLRSIDATTLAESMIDLALERGAENRVVERDELPPRRVRALAR